MENKKNREKHVFLKEEVKTHNLIICLLFLLIIVTSPIGKLSAQSTLGKDFWVTFLPASEPEGQSIELSLIISGDRTCSGTIINPNTNWTSSFTVSPGITTSILIPKSQAYEPASDTIVNKGLHVVSEDTISLFASNFLAYSFDVTNVLPTPSLGSEYIIQNYPDVCDSNMSDPSDGLSEFSIVAIEDSTLIDINLNCDSYFGQSAHQPYSVVLNAGQCYQVTSTLSGNLNGTHIKARDSKKIALFAGNWCTYIPYNKCCCDHIVEQLMPINCWGKKFVVTGSKLRSKDIVRITALNNNCKIWKNGSLQTTIDARQTYQFVMTANTPALYIETSEPASVFLYLTGAQYGGADGDPSMVIINPIEQKISNVTFSTFNSGSSHYHYINVVTDTDKKAYMRLDGNNIASQFSSVPGNSDYSYARIQVSHGSHTLSNAQGAFIAHVYGLGDYESYAYSVGSMARILTTQLIVDGQYVLDYPNGFFVCENTSIDFELNLNFNPSLIIWSFGDGTTGSGQSIVHSYNVPGNYNVSCDVYKSEQGQNILISSLNTQIHVKEAFQEEVTETQCDSYMWNGTTYNQSGDYVYEGSSLFGCDSIVNLHLTINPSKTAQLNISSCGSYEWYGETYTQSGIYQHMDNTSEGCDSLIVLNLSIGSEFYSEESITSCNSYTWRGNIYTESGIYEEESHSPNGCDSTFVLNLTVGNDYDIETDVNACNEYQWNSETYTESGQYTQIFNTSLGCDSLVTINLTVVNTKLEENVMACNEYLWRGEVYSSSGIYQDIVDNPNGCDSIYILNLEISHESSYDVYEVACEEYDWSGETFTESGDYTRSFSSVYGCDSIVTLHLDIMHHLIHETQQELSCDPEFFWHGQKLTENGIYYDTITNAIGCQDYYTLDLEFGQHYAYAESITICDTFPWPTAQNGILTESGYYYYEGMTSDGCDSIVSVYLTIEKTPIFEIHGITQVAYSSDIWPGIYYYCIDSIGILPNSILWSCSNSDWILNPLGDGYCCELIAKNQGHGTLTATSDYESGCNSEKTIEINATNFEVDELDQIFAVVFPNPTNGKLFVQAEQTTRIRIFDSLGQLVLDMPVDNQDTTFINTSDLVSGLYLIEITNNNGRTIKHIIVL